MKFLIKEVETSVEDKLYTLSKAIDRNHRKKKTRVKDVLHRLVYKMGSKSMETAVLVGFF